MTKRLLMLLLLLAGLAMAQPTLFMTKGEANGFFWKDLTEDLKVSFLVGIDSGRGFVAHWYLADSPVCSDIVLRGKAGPHITNADTAKEVDKFYQNPSNVPLPISLALVYIYKRLTGASQQELDQFRASALKAYVK